MYKAGHDIHWERMRKVGHRLHEYGNNILCCRRYYSFSYTDSAQTKDNNVAKKERVEKKEKKDKKVINKKKDKKHKTRKSGKRGGKCQERFRQ